jgi:putative ribosome biogenesis GTPase RsgA
MEEIKSSDSEKSQYPVYLVVGDSGAGKSTFVNKVTLIEGAKKAYAPI